MSRKKSILFLISLVFLISTILIVTAKPLLSAQRGPIPGLNAQTSYCFFYEMIDECNIKELKKFKLVILHPGTDHALVTPSQVASLKEAGVIVIGYIPFGEDYIGTREGDGKGPAYYDEQQCCLIYQNKGLASWYVDDNDHNGVPDENPNFNSFYVNAGDLAWQNFIKTATILSDGFAGTDYILNYLGCDGIFIDVIETASPWGHYNYSWKGMFDLLDKISNLYPADKYMVVNRPLFSCRLDSYPLCSNNPEDCQNFCFDFSSQSEARNKFRENINAFVWESYSLDREFNDFPFTRDTVLTCANNSDGLGFNVAVLDYFNLIHDLYPSMDDQIEEVRNLGWLDYIAPGPLYFIGYWVYNYYHSICSILIDGYFNEWRPWNVSYCRSDPIGDIQKENADLIDISITHDTGYLYLKIRCKEPIPDPFSPNFYQIYLDSGSNSLGYKGPDSWKGEFEFLWENGKLFQYTGSGTDWSWNEVMSTPYALDLEDNKGMEIAISRCAIGAEKIEGQTTNIVFKVNAYDVGASDCAPDDPTKDYYTYEYKPLINIDGEIEDWNMLSKKCGHIFTMYNDKSNDMANCSVDIIRSWICSDLANIYFRIQFSCALSDPLWGDNKFYQIFLDVDQNPSTGYRGSQCQWKIGADYLWENGNLHKHTGGSCGWVWQYINTASYAVFSSDKSQIEISIPRSNIFAPSCKCGLSEEQPLRFLLMANTIEGTDVAPNLPEKNYYVWPRPFYNGDLNSDGAINNADRNILRRALRKCTGNNGFVAEADYDSDGCITYYDYREWYKYYRGYK